MESFTKVPNEIQDTLPYMSRAEMVITTILCRYTYGYHKQYCRMTWREFMQLSGASKGTIQKGIKEVRARGFFVNNGGLWECASGLKNRPSGAGIEPDGLKNDGLKNRPRRSKNRTALVQKIDQGGLKIEPHIKKPLNKDIKKNNKESDTPPSSPSPIQELSDYFVELTGCKYVDSRDKWWMPLVEINQIARENFNDTKRLIKLSVGILREKGYTISTPSSILKTAQGSAYQLDKEFTNESEALKSASVLWIEVMQKARTNRFDFDDETKKAVQKIGWGNLRKMEQGQISSYKKSFIDNYTELLQNAG